MIELPRQHIAAISEPPDFEGWKKRVSLASDEELKNLQVAAHAGLRGDGGSNQRWSPYIGIVESEMRQRGIKP
jgi:hypothetical protein